MKKWTKKRDETLVYWVEWAIKRELDNPYGEAFLRASEELANDIYDVAKRWDTVLKPSHLGEKVRMQEHIWKLEKEIGQFKKTRDCMLCGGTDFMGEVPCPNCYLDFRDIEQTLATIATIPNKQKDGPWDITTDEQDTAITHLYNNAYDWVSHLLDRLPERRVHERT